MFKTNFCAVPDFIRVLPVTNSGPTTSTIGWSGTIERGDPGLQVIPAVNMLLSLHARSAPITYGVVPEAAIPTTVSNL